MKQRRWSILKCFNYLKVVWVRWRGLLLGDRRWQRQRVGGFISERIFVFILA